MTFNLHSYLNARFYLIPILPESQTQLHPQPKCYQTLSCPQNKREESQHLSKQASQWACS